ncbi:hypothetical protein [Halomicrobium katesii]|uniref:hypothetical protein n=1 Tax=Halomicrobium katesii TaxID=437163 RepID=UPI00037A369D|nr:hypothetical protein [Halomicrobium katesii]
MTETALGAIRPLVGMVHLPALPGTPGFADRATVREHALADMGGDALVGLNGFVPRTTSASWSAGTGSGRFSRSVSNVAPCPKIRCPT